MMTHREARQRNELNCVRMVHDGSNYVVTLQEWSVNHCQRFGYYTDDLEDAVLTGSAMRRQDSTDYVRTVSSQFARA